MLLTHSNHSRYVHESSSHSQSFHKRLLPPIEVLVFCYEIHEDVHFALKGVFGDPVKLLYGHVKEFLHKFGIVDQNGGLDTSHLES